MFNEKAYKYSVRDDTSFRVEGGNSGSSDLHYSTAIVTVSVTGDGTMIVTCPSIGEGSGVSYASSFYAIYSSSKEINAILYDGVCHIVAYPYGPSEVQPVFSVSGNVEVSGTEAPATIFKVTGNGSIAIATADSGTPVM